MKAHFSAVNALASGPNTSQAVRQMRWGVDWRRMAEKRFVVHLKDGTIQTILAESGDEDEEAAGYLFFIDSAGAIAALFHKEIVESWREDPDPRP